VKESESRKAGKSGRPKVSPKPEEENNSEIENGEALNEVNPTSEIDLK
jgi:hypothetical protein